MFHDIVMRSCICFLFQTNLGNMEAIRYNKEETKQAVAAIQREKDFLQNNAAVLALEMRCNQKERWKHSEFQWTEEKVNNSNNKNNSNDNNNNNNSGSDINNFVQPVNCVQVLQILQRRYSIN